MFRQIHEIVFHGKGGYDWETAYHMPLWLRKTTYNLMKEHYDKEKEEHDKAMNKGKMKNEIARPNVAPSSSSTYTTKAPRK